jgi:7,8-dihydro-6-hydroxymethylpterin-pyrophosphokinase
MMGSDLLSNTKIRRSSQIYEMAAPSYKVNLKLSFLNPISIYSITMPMVHIFLHLTRIEDDLSKGFSRLSRIIIESL